MGCSCSNCCSSSCSTSTCGSCQCSSCSSSTCTAVCTALEVANSWNVPACSASAVLAIPGLTTVLIGSYIYNPTYGQYRITAFDSVNGQITVTNDCIAGNAAPGTVVPALTTFIFVGEPQLMSEDGWIAAGETWTYLSASSVTVPTDATNKYRVGDKVKYLLNGVQQYQYIAEVSTTVLQFIPNTDYVLTNNTITEASYSHAETPLDFPSYFNYDGAPTGFSAVPASALYTFRMTGGYISVDVTQPNAGTSDSLSFTIAAPYTAKTVAGGRWGVYAYDGVDNGVVSASGGSASITSGSAVITAIPGFGITGNWSNVLGKSISFTNLVYPI